MSTLKQKSYCMSITRHIIFILICVSVLTESPVSDFCAVLSAAIWLWMPKIIKFELRVLDEIKKERK